MGSITLICTSEQIKIHLDLLIALYLMLWTINHPMYPPAISREHRSIWHLITSRKLHYCCWNCCIWETSGLQHIRRNTVVTFEFYKMVWTASFNVISCQCQYFEKLTNEFRGGSLVTVILYTAFVDLLCTPSRSCTPPLFPGDAKHIPKYFTLWFTFFLSFHQGTSHGMRC